MSDYLEAYNVAYSEIDVTFDDDFLDVSYDTAELRLIYDNILRTVVSEAYLDKIKRYKTITPLKSKDLKYLIDKIYSHRSHIVNQKRNKIQRQLHILHLLSILFNDVFYKEYLQVCFSKEEFEDQFIKPNIYIIILKYFRDVGQFVRKIVTTQYEKFKEHSEDSIRIYLLLFDSDKKIIQHDIIYNVIFKLGPTIDALSLENIDDFYTDQIQQLIYQYLKHKLEGVVNHDLSLSMLQDHPIQEVSDRYYIYKHGFNLYTLQNMCKMSETARCITTNFDQITGIICDNELQQMFLKYSGEEISMLDRQSLLIKVHEKLVSMNELRKNYPLVYKLLQCVKVSTNTMNVTEQLYEEMKLAIHAVLFKKFNKLVKDQFVTQLVSILSTNLSRSIAYSKFIDPVDMRVYFITQQLVHQLAKFLSIIIINHPNAITTKAT